MPASVAQLACRMTDDAFRVADALARGVKRDVHPAMIWRVRNAERTLARQGITAAGELTALGREVLAEYRRRHPAIG